MNNFTKYTSREEKIMNDCLDQMPWLKEIVERVEKDNTPLHDAKLILKNGDEYTVEIKEEEDFWYSKTGNFGFDYISVFYFEDEPNDWLGDRTDSRRYWINSDDIEAFIDDIRVDKYGKLVTCDADIQLHAVYDKKTKLLKMVKLYNSEKLTSVDFNNYVKETYNLRINKKNNYNLDDNWESAAYMINPLTDERLIDCEIKNKQEFLAIK